MTKGGDDELVQEKGLQKVTPGYVDDDTAGEGETVLELWSDILFGLAFLVTALVAARRNFINYRLQSSTSNSSSSSAAETTVVTAFYSLILATSLLRAIYFLVPAKWWQPSYTPIAVYAFDTTHKSWVGVAISELTVTAGSLTLFSIFILILVYWADILKKYYNPGSRRTLPMMTFLILVSVLVGLELINLVCFLTKRYTTEGMVLFHAVLLAVTSMICVFEITVFSKKFRNVLKTLGAINQVSTDSQVRRIVWITITGNLFFLTRFLLEAIFAINLGWYWFQNGTVDKAFTHVFWDTYEFLKYISELTILALMLHILQSRFSGNVGGSAGVGGETNAAGYTKVPDTEPEGAVVV